MLDWWIQAGFTAIQLAAKNGHDQVIDVLRSANADTLRHASKRTGLTALHVAAYYGQPGLLHSFLLESDWLIQLLC